MNSQLNASLRPVLAVAESGMAWWMLQPRAIKIRRGAEWVDGLALALDDETREIDAILGRRVLRPAQEPSPEHLRLKAGEYIVEDDPLPNVPIEYS
jgi:hypothetical protein